MDVSMVLAGAALLYLLPFTIATLKSLQPGNMAQWLASRDDLDSLEDMMRRAIGDKSIALLRDSIEPLADRAERLLERDRGLPATAQDPAQRLISVGRVAAQQVNADAVLVVMETLDRLITYYNAYPRNWRDAADVFYQALNELYTYTEDWL